MASGVTLTITDWTYGVDYFYSLYGDPGPTVRSRIVFSGYTPGNANWLPIDHEISPVPEPSMYGAVFMFLGFCGVAWRWMRGNRRAQTKAEN